MPETEKARAEWFESEFRKSGRFKDVTDDELRRLAKGAAATEANCVAILGPRLDALAARCDELQIQLDELRDA